MARLQHKKGRPSNYQKKLKNNPDWQKVVRKVRIRDKFQCVICTEKIRLETHHITYKVQNKSIVGREIEHLEWLVTLCETCHSKVHKDKKHPFNPFNYKKVTVNNYDRNNGNSTRN